VFALFASSMSAATSALAAEDGGVTDAGVTALHLPASTAGTLSLPSDPLPSLRDDVSRAAAALATQEPAQPAIEGATRSFLSTLVHNLGDDVKHLPRMNSVYWAVGGGAAAVAVHPLDQTLNQHLLGSSSWDAFFAPGQTIGSTQVQIAASVLTYTIGRARGKNNVRHLGMDLMEAQLLTEGIVEGLKAVVQRERPPNPDGSPNSSKTFSFPSGHAAITFAGATVLQQHLGWKAAVPTYAVASYVAISRLHDNRHYLSDVVFGAATGVIVGRSVTWHGRNSYPITPIVAPDLVGLLIQWR